MNPQELIKCRFARNGCSKYFNNDRIEDHIKFCIYKELECPSCQQMVTHNDLSMHVTNECPCRLISCVECGMKIWFVAQQAHSEECLHSMFIVRRMKKKHPHASTKTIGNSEKCEGKVAFAAQKTKSKKFLEKILLCKDCKKPFASESEKCHILISNNLLEIMSQDYQQTLKKISDLCANQTVTIPILERTSSELRVLVESHSAVVGEFESEVAKLMANSLDQEYEVEKDAAISIQQKNSLLDDDELFFAKLPNDPKLEDVEIYMRSCLSKSIERIPISIKTFENPTYRIIQFCGETFRRTIQVKFTTEETLKCNLRFTAAKGYFPLKGIVMCMIQKETRLVLFCQSKSPTGSNRCLFEDYSLDEEIWNQIKDDFYPTIYKFVFFGYW